ncbi:hypothetical protein A7317_10945 [Pseudomonas fluorescens]|nr:hypothetical protein A7317_10945 [Pseudomonas fluorescens]
MVLHQHQHVLVFTQGEQADPQQRTLLQIERPRDFGFHARLEPGLVDRAFSDPDHGMGQHFLGTLFIAQVQTGAQAFMPRHQGIEAALQGSLVQPPAQAQGSGDVIRGAVRVELPEEPLALLGVGQRQVLAVLADCGNRQLSETHATALQTLIELLALFQRQAKKARDQVDIRVGKHGSNRL